MTKKMLIDATHPEETRVVVLDGNKVDNFDFESINKKQLAGNIYLAKVTRVEPSLQAAFVEYGGNRHGFLAFSEIHPDYYQIPVADREAILAEEEREAAAEAEAEAKAAGDAPAPKRRSRSRKTKAAAEPKAVPQPESEPSPEPDAATPAKARRSRRKSAAPRGGTSGALDVIDLEGGGASAEAEPLGAAAAPGSDAAGAPDGPPARPADTAAERAAPADADPADTAPEPAEVLAPAPGEAEGNADMPAPEAAAGTRGDPAPLDTAVSEDAQEAGPPALDVALATQPQPEDADPAETPPDDGPDADTLPDAAETPLPDTPEDETPDGGAGGSGPRSIAESAGLDEETVTEEIASDGETQEKPRSRRSRGGRGGKGRAAKAKQGEDEAAAEASKPRARKGKTAPAEAEEEDAAPGEVETAGAEDIREEVSRERAIRRRRYKIQDVIKVRQILLVQVVKEERGNKGAALTTYLSLAGRYCVLMPNTARGGGISRKITNAPDRKRLREIVGEMEVPRGMGLIVRTAGAERTRPEIKRDYEFLLRQWEQIRDLTLKSIAPTLIYEEGSLIKRSIRDLYSKEIESVLVEGEAGYKEAKAYMKMLMPSHARNVKQYSDTVPLFIRYQVESYLNAMFSPVVQLKSGGYIVIGVTEALVAIDVNSGRSTKEGSVEDTAVKTNLEAADEVARQLRLRDLAGLIVIDFIDMDERKNNAAVEKRMKERLKTDRARIQIGRISAFGLMEMSRQRLRPGMLEASTKPCPHCHGTGTIRSDDSLSLAILREVEEQAIRADAAELAVTTPVEIANFLINAKRAHVAMIEERHGVTIGVYGDPAMASPDFKVERLRGKPRDAEARAPAPAAAVTAESGADDAPPEPAAPAEAGTRAQPKTDAGAARSAEAAAGEDEAGKSRRRRGKRGGRRRRGRAEGGEGDAHLASGSDTAAAEAAPAHEQEGTAPAAGEMSHDRSGSDTAAPEPTAPDPTEAEPASASGGEDAPAKPRARSGRTRRSRAKAAAAEAPSQASDAGPGEASASPEDGHAPAQETDAMAPGGSDGDGASGASGTAASPEPPVGDAAAPIAAMPGGEAAAPDAPEGADQATPGAMTQDAPAGAGAEAASAGPGADTPEEYGDAGQGAGIADHGAAETTGEADPDRPARPKRRGWWTLGF